MLKQGDSAPSFRLPDQHGKLIDLEQFRGKNPVVIYFYPRDYTPGCTRQACSIRDNYSSIQALGVAVLGISKDPIQRHLEFSEDHGLPFQLLADETGEVIEAYKAKGLLGITSRTTYLIDESGIVQLAYKNAFNPTRHIRRVLEELKTNPGFPPSGAEFPTSQ